MQRLFLLLACILIGSTCFSQDRIFKKGGEVIKAKIIEIGTDEIKYKIYDDPDGIIYAIEKESIIKVVYRNGRSESYKTNLTDAQVYADQQKNALKMNFLAPLLGHFQVGFEHSIRPGRSYELTASIVGLGKNAELDYSFYNNEPKVYRRNAKGFIAGGGYKFIKLPDFLNRGIRYSHLLQGIYAKPQLYTGVYGEDVLDNKTAQLTVNRRTTVFGSLEVELGRQWVFGNKFLLDFYFGLGYVLDNVKGDDSVDGFSSEYAAHHFSVVRLGRSPGFGTNVGLKMGLLLNK